MGLKFSKKDIVYNIPFVNSVKETNYLVFDNGGGRKYIDLTENIKHTDFPNIKFTKNGIVRYARTKYETHAGGDNVKYEPDRYVDYLQAETKTTKEFSFVLNGFENIIIAFLYDLCLQHTWNKKDSKSIYGGYITGTPVTNMTDFYVREGWEIRDSVIPTQDIDVSSINKIKETATFYFEVKTSFLNSDYKKVWTRQYRDGYGVRTTELNYYLKIIDGILYLKEEFAFVAGKGSDRSTAVVKRKYKYVISNYD